MLRLNSSGGAPIRRFGFPWTRQSIADLADLDAELLSGRSGGRLAVSDIRFLPQERDHCAKGSEAVGIRNAITA
jgi:hypothetical protein